MAARVVNERNLAIAAGLSALAREAGCRPAQLALAWLLARPGAALVPIIGARNAAQLAENLGALALRPSDELLARVGALSAPVPEYPQGLLAGEFFQRLMHGDVAARRGRRFFRD